VNKSNQQTFILLFLIVVVDVVFFEPISVCENY
jgi:hypothetical protein